LEDAWNDLREVKVRRWRKRTNTGGEWASVVKEVMVIRGLELRLKKFTTVNSLLLLFFN
jgi:hypothetical protein